MTPEKIAELEAYDQKVADAFVACDASYIALKEAVLEKNAFVKTLFVE